MVTFVIRHVQKTDINNTMIRFSLLIKFRIFLLYLYFSVISLIQNTIAKHDKPRGERIKHITRDIKHNGNTINIQRITLH